jgi:hypothetical protein
LRVVRRPVSRGDDTKIVRKQTGCEDGMGAVEGQMYVLKALIRMNWFKVSHRG